MSRIATLTLNPAMDVSTDIARLAPTSKLRCTLPRYEPGGGGINVARVIRNLGGDTVAIYPAGGPFGAMLQRALEELGLPELRVPIAGDTRESFTVDEGETGLQYRFVLPGPTLTPDERQACLEAIAALVPPPDYLVVSGSFPTGVALDFHDEIVALAQRIGARLILDYSGDALRHAVERGGIHLLKPSLSELSGLTGRVLESQVEQEAAARGLVEQGAVEIVVLSLGAEGALLASREGLERFPAFEVPLRSAVGAGDSVVGATVLALSRGWSLHDAVRYGMAAAAATLMLPGTGLCRAEDVERLFRKG
ncbi:1-phosphofructokinase family hexose kinase [Azotobacter beijerinckii]|uniref:Phosphofructokinase n=1 Tax=Azotobacter beijerinckii TaxID=170623 RepID=A0A1I4E8D3_9GAMM|nr:1-phosphofructokinase family hexose kinase [Azotobacter beijerinckii]SFB47147.1 6-phosphofructokinase 2 [Azotobacter beijerinckii]SFL02064.1 6-phosphofructokinase 2 [Azotobacter beijerinckii]